MPVWRCFTKSASPPVALNTSLVGSSSRSSISWISRPLVRKASSWSRSVRVSRLNSVSSKISGSGQNVTVVPVFRLALPFANFFVGLPRENVCVHT